MKELFSQGQMAIAFAIVQSIPESFSINDYCTELHKSIVPNPTSTPKRHVDSCEFWKGLYERSYQEMKDLQGKVRVLEERQRIFERSQTLELGDQDHHRTSRKRPAGLEEIEEWIDDEGTDPILPIGDENLLLSGYTLRIVRARRDLEKNIKTPSVPEYIDSLSTSACELLNLLETALADCLVPISSLKCNDESQAILLLQQMMAQVTLAYLSSLEALQELTCTIPGRKKRFDLTHRLVTFFSKALAYLHSLSERQAESENEERRRLGCKRARIAESEYVSNKYLSRTLVQICQVDWKVGQLAHSEVLEGIICSVLNRTARLLSDVVFMEHVAASDKPGNISNDRPASPTAATKFEFRYIVPVLHAALGGPTRKELVLNVLAESRRTGRSVDGSLILIAKKLLQNTLVKSAVGADVEGLKLPVAPDDAMVYAPGVSHHVEPYGSEWFLESVWALVGWELAV